VRADEDIAEKLDKRLAEFESAGETLVANHEFIANFVGSDEVLVPTHRDLVALGCSGDPPKGGGWIYMHVWRPLTRESVLRLAGELQQIASNNQSLFELLDVSLTSPSSTRKIVILGTCDDEAFLNA
jgi:hypothetical protein